MTIAFFGATPVTSELVAAGVAGEDVFVGAGEELHPIAVNSANNAPNCLYRFNIVMTNANGSMGVRA